MRENVPKFLILVYLDHEFAPTNYWVWVLSLKFIPWINFHKLFTKTFFFIKNAFNFIKKNERILKKIYSILKKTEKNMKRIHSKMSFYLEFVSKSNIVKERKKMWVWISYFSFLGFGSGYKAQTQSFLGVIVWSKYTRINWYAPLI